MKSLLVLSFIIFGLIAPRSAQACDDPYRHGGGVSVRVSVPIPVVAYCPYGHSVHDGHRSCGYGHGYSLAVSGYAWHPAGFWYRTGTRSNDSHYDSRRDSSHHGHSGHAQRSRSSAGHHRSASSHRRHR